MPSRPEFHDLLSLLPSSQAGSATRLGLTIQTGLDRDGWSRLVAVLVQTAGRTANNRDTLTAWLGDLLAYGSDKYRGQITEYAKAAGLAPGTLRDAKLVCSRIPVSSRRDSLSWSHHCEVGKAFKELRDVQRWLAMAEKEGYSRAELRRQIRSALARERSGSVTPVGVAGSENFALLRELRTLGRFVNNHTKSWKAWSPETCERALSELAPVTAFIAKIESRASKR